MERLKQWSVRAVNLPEHADNAMHTDEGAKDAGFEAALVAGTTVYAYLTHPPAAAWGLSWLEHGGGELRLRRPVLDGEQVDLIIDDEDGPIILAEVNGEQRASLEVWRHAPAIRSRDGERLAPIKLTMNEERLGYATRAGDDLELYAKHGIVHPVMWPRFANSVFKKHLVTGPWVHVRSRISHQGVASVDATFTAESTLVDRFDSRAGERAIVDVQILADDKPVAVVEHEAIIALA